MKIRKNAKNASEATTSKNDRYTELRNRFEFKQEFETQLTIEEAKFIFYQVEKHLQITIDNSNNIINRTSILLGISVTILSSIIIYCGQQLLGKDKQIDFTIVGIVTSVYLYILIFKMVSIFRGFKYQSLGSEPITLLNNFFSSLTRIKRLGRFRLYCQK